MHKVNTRALEEGQKQRGLRRRLKLVIGHKTIDGMLHKTLFLGFGMKLSSELTASSEPFLVKLFPPSDQPDEFQFVLMKSLQFIFGL